MPLFTDDKYIYLGNLEESMEKLLELLNELKLLDTSSEYKLSSNRSLKRKLLKQLPFIFRVKFNKTCARPLHRKL